MSSRVVLTDQNSFLKGLTPRVFCVSLAVDNKCNGQINRMELWKSEHYISEVHFMKNTQQDIYDPSLFAVFI